MNELVYIKDLKIYGNIINSWEIINNDIKETNYIIKDMVGIEHERVASEIEFVNDIDTSIKEAKCNLPLETLIDLINDIDKECKLVIETSLMKDINAENSYIPFVKISYNKVVYNPVINDIEEKIVLIKNKSLLVNLNNNVTDYDYECCIWYYNRNVKDVLFELYMNIITRIAK
jgi:hypothetical protein